MEINLPYKKIKNDSQHREYCKIVYDLMHIENHTEEQGDLMDLLCILLEAYDNEHREDYYNEPVDPVSSLKFVMEQNRMKAADLARELGVSKSLVSDILNYRRGFSKAFIRKLGKRFSFREELWNMPYKLKRAKRKKASKSTKTAKSSKASKPSKTSKPTKALRSSGSSKASKPIRRIKSSKSSKAKVA